MGSGASRGQLPTLYIFPMSAPCRAVLMTAEAAKIALEHKQLDLFKDEQKNAEFLKINPDHTVPTLDDHGFYLWESRAIMTYLVDKYASGHSIYPKDPAHRALINRYLFCDVSFVDRNIGEFVRPQLFRHEPADQDKQAAVEKALDYLEEQLKEEYLTGKNVTIADFSVMASTSLLELLDWHFERWPKVHEWRDRLKKLPYYEKVNKPLEDFKQKKTRAE